MGYKKCPGCGGQLLSHVPLCGACGFEFPVIAQQIPSASQEAKCSNCDYAANTTAIACQKCGYYFEVPSTSVVMPRLSDLGWEIPVEDASANYITIVAMWLTTATAGAVLVLFGLWAAAVVDIGAICLAISLVGSQSVTNPCVPQ